MTSLDGDGRQIRRQHARLPFVVLAVKDGRARHRHHVDADPFIGEAFLRLERDGSLCAGTDYDRDGFIGAGVGCASQHVAATADLVGTAGAGHDEWRALAGECERRRTIAVFDARGPGNGGLEAVRRPPHVEIGYQPQRRHVLDALVCRPVLTDPNAVMREHVDHALVHQRRHA